NSDPLVEVDATEELAYSASLSDDASEVDGDPMTFAKVSGPAWLSIAGDGTLSGTPANQDVGINSFTVSVTDGSTPAVQATLNITVNNVNDAPVFTVDPIPGGSVVEDEAYTGTLAGSATDEDGDPLVYAKVAGPAWLIVASDGTLSGTPTGSDIGLNSFTVSASDGIATAVQATLDISVSAVSASSSKLVRTTLSAVGNDNWTSVDLGQNYTSAVIVATPVLPSSTHPPVVTRLRNVSGSSFEIKIERLDGLTGTLAVDVHIIAVEEGVYTAANDGVTMEAVKYTSTVTAAKNNWVAESRTYQNTYTNPVVVGQVMSSNDPNWSVFWCQGSSRTSPPSASSLSTGKNVAEDPNQVRADETIGYIVIEAGSGTLDGINLVAGLGADTVQGPGNSSSGYTYSFSGLSSASTAAVSLAAMDGADGGFAVLTGATPLTTTSMTLFADEDQLGDGERGHTTEQVGYIVFE
ncbi:MAG: putative Ig domain-containing protein, partial [Opitutales bacterium]